MESELCAKCLSAVEAQQAAMAPRNVTKGIGLLLTADAFKWLGITPSPDLRVGDYVRVELVAGAVPDIGFCEDCE